MSRKWAAGNSRGHFFAAAAEAMRRILVEGARRKGRLKRGGDRRRVDLDAMNLAMGDRSDDVLALDEALTKLAKARPEIAELVKLRYFAGLSVDDARQGTWYRRLNRRPALDLRSRMVVSRIE